MSRAWLTAGLVMALLVAAVFGLARPVPITAQAGPMYGQGMPHGPVGWQPLDQLSGDEFDRAFLMQMTMHHEMAVVMTQPVAANAEHQELRDLANQIVADQTSEIAQMREWLRAWYGIEMPDMAAMMAGSTTGHHPMTTGHHTMMGQGQVGDMGHMSMMTDLWKLPSSRLEAVFMSLMIPHHEGAIEMANLALERAAHQEIKEMAERVVASQSLENQHMHAWLAAWYGL